MSRESAEWLNTMTLIGFTTKRGNAWHYQEALQGEESNHYPEAIPVADVHRRLFNFQAVSEPLYVRHGAEFVEVPGRQAISTSDTGDVLGVFKLGYQPHQYGEWLVQNVERILNSSTGLGIGSAGLLRNRAQAWVSVEVPENIRTAEGVEFRANLLAYTSFDGSLATGYKEAATFTVCDNTFAMARAEGGKAFKLKHTRFSGSRIKDAQEALGILAAVEETYRAEIGRLTSLQVSSAAWNKTLDILVPITGADGLPLEGRGKTMAENKRDELVRLYLHDDRVAPWSGTAFGVLQAFNTYDHHYGIVRNASRVQRNRDNLLSGKREEADARVLAVVGSVTA
jgi:phage/plasmid-like protein (TIGR03299 family)